MKRPTVVNKRHEPYNVYIGRGSIWGNPFSHLPESKALYRVKTREDAIKQYRDWIMLQPELLGKLPDLAGKRLGCYCAPLSCHGDVIADLVEKLDSRPPDEVREAKEGR